MLHGRRVGLDPHVLGLAEAANSLEEVYLAIVGAAAAVAA